MKFGICDICGLHAIIYGVPKYNVCKNCLPEWHSIQANKYIKYMKKDISE